MPVSAQAGKGKTQKDTEQQRQTVGQEPLRRGIKIDAEPFAHASENDAEGTVSAVGNGADCADIFRVPNLHIH